MREKAKLNTEEHTGAEELSKLDEELARSKQQTADLEADLSVAVEVVAKMEKNYESASVSSSEAELNAMDERMFKAGQQRKRIEAKLRDNLQRTAHLEHQRAEVFRSVKARELDASNDALIGSSRETEEALTRFLSGREKVSACIKHSESLAVLAGMNVEVYRRLTKELRLWSQMQLEPHSLGTLDHEARTRLRGSLSAAFEHYLRGSREDATRSVRTVTGLS